nr:hypothetical protein [Pseudomonas rhodesiae]
MLSAAGATIDYAPHGPDVVMAADFDRVTAELQRELDHKEQQRESELRNGQAGDRLVGELEQRLTAADERADVLEGVVASAYETAAKWVEKRMDDYVNEHGNEDPETGSLELPGAGDEYVGELMEIADGLRALKPAEPSKCEHMYVHYGPDQPRRRCNWCNKLEPVEQPAPVAVAAPDRIKGMIETVGGEYAVMIDPDNRHFGWTFKRHPDGQWVSGRKATDAEMSAARSHAHITNQL